MRPPRTAIAGAVVALALAAGLWAFHRLDTTFGPLAGAAAAAVGAAALFRLIVVPALRRRGWKRIAQRRGFDFTASTHGELLLTGAVDGHAVTAGISAAPIAPSRHPGHSARTLVSANVPRGLPTALRIYRRDSTLWMTKFSGLQSVSVDDEELTDRFMIEGAADDDVRAFLARPGVRDELLTCAEAYPSMIIYGADAEELPASPAGGSGAVTLLVGGRVSDATALGRMIDDALHLARVLDE